VLVDDLPATLHGEIGFGLDDAQPEAQGLLRAG
jgi:hypothetical protein